MNLTPPPTDRPRRYLAGCRVLVIEDEFLIALDLQRILEDLDAADIVLASTAARAEAAIASDVHFDLALVDLKLGADDMRPLANRIAARKIPLILATGSDPLDLGPRAMVIRKPFSDDDVIAAILAVLVSRHDRSANSEKTETSAEPISPPGID